MEKRQVSKEKILTRSVIDDPYFIYVPRPAVFKYTDGRQQIGRFVRVVTTRPKDQMFLMVEVKLSRTQVKRFKELWNRADSMWTTEGYDFAFYKIPAKVEPMPSDEVSAGTEKVTDGLQRTDISNVIEFECDGKSYFVRMWVKHTDIAEAMQQWKAKGNIP